ncbi:MAG: DUF2080 family transposase-associated protein [Nanoarchaeota archaeon]
MEFTRQVSRWGNSAGVLLPRECIGKEAKIIVIDRTLEIKKEVFSILDKKLSRILGIYLVGSYARNEQKDNSDIDILAISDDLQEEIASGKYHLSIVPILNIKNAIKLNPILIMPRLIEAKPLFNASLLEELKRINLKRKLFIKFIAETKRMRLISKELIELDKLDSKYLASTHVIYSLILRLRSLFIINCLLSSESYTNKDFLSRLALHLGENNAVQLYRVYKEIKGDKPIKEKVSIELAEKLLALLNLELKKW